jgi:hypothetical protein
MNRTGKIARLPYNTRQELNRRLLDNEPGDALLAWLNARPEVQAVLGRQFDGNPISKQNLSDWRTGGFAIWELRQEVFGDALEAEEASDELDAATHSGLADKLMTLLAGRYASLLIRWDGEITPAFTQKLRALHGLCRDLNVLRREARGAGREAGKTKPEPASGVATARRHMEPETGKVEGSGMNEESGERPGTSDQSKPVAPSRTTSASDLVMSALAELAKGGRHPEPAGKPLPGMPNSMLSNALKAARAKAASGEPVLAVLPDWVEAALVAQPAGSVGKK